MRHSRRKIREYFSIFEKSIDKYVKYKKINAVEFIVRYKQSFKETRE